MIERAAARYGWRGLWLVLVGATWLLFAAGQLATPIEPRPWVLHEHLPGWFTAGGWAITGAVALWTGTRGRVVDDSLGHVALYLMPAIRILSYAAASLVWAITYTLHHLISADVKVTGYAGGWYAALLWGLISTMLLVASRWPNPRPPLPRPLSSREEM